MKRSFIFCCSAAASVLLAFTGCTTPDVHVSDGLQQTATVLPVEGRSALRVSLGKEKGFRFGAYQLEDIKRGWTRRSENGPSFFQVEEAYQKYSFGVRDTVRQKTWFVQAAALLNAATLQAEGFSLDLNKQREFLQVAFQSPESGEWRLSLADPGHYLQRRNFMGKLSNSTYELEVLPLYKWEKKSLPSSTPLGYEFSQDRQALATVQTVNNGKVWLKNSLSPDLQMVLASACSSLLLYNQLEENR